MATYRIERKQIGKAACWVVISTGADSVEKMLTKHALQGEARSIVDLLNGVSDAPTLRRGTWRMEDGQAR